MANRQSTMSNQSDKTKKRVITSIWLIMALLSGVTALALWMFSSAPAFNKTKVEKEKKLTEEVMSSTIGKIKSIDELNELDDAVHPISFDALIRDLRDYPPEFKDSKYFKRHKGEWTVQVMDVSEHKIITDYLDTRDDREKFAYFRYRDENDQPRYLLTYDTMKSPQLAMGTAKTIDFDLPANITVLPEEIDVYLGVIENYELTPPIKDLSTNKARKIKLQPTERELEAKSEQQETANRSQSDSATQASNQSSNDVTLFQEPIKESKDTNKVLSVQEQRKIDQQALEDTNKPKNNVSTNAPKNEERPVVAEPTKPKDLQSEARKEKKAVKDESSEPAKSVDAIKRLIDEKTQ